MPIAEDPPPPFGREDPYAGLVLDEAFVRAATIKEPSARRRDRAARRRRYGPAPLFALVTVALAAALALGAGGHSSPAPPVKVERTR